MPAPDDRFRFPVCLMCLDKMDSKPEFSYKPFEMMQGCAPERQAETKKLYGAPSEKCCLCGGMSIAALYVKDDPRPAKE